MAADYLRSWVAESLRSCDAICADDLAPFPYATNVSVCGCLLVGGSEEAVRAAAAYLAELIDRERGPVASPAGSRDGTTVREMVAEWLRGHGYQGLVMVSHECGCGLADLMPCGGCDASACAAAYEFRCHECALSDRCDQCDGGAVYSTDENWCEEFEGRSVPDDPERRGH